MSKSAIDFTRYTAVPASSVFSGNHVLPQFTQIVDSCMVLLPEKSTSGGEPKHFQPSSIPVPGSMSQAAQSTGPAGYHGNSKSPNSTVGQTHPFLPVTHNQHLKYPGHNSVGVTLGSNGNQGSVGHPLVSPGYHGIPESPVRSSVAPGYHGIPKSPVQSTTAPGYHGMPKCPVYSSVAPGYHGMPKSPAYLRVAPDIYGNPKIPSNPSGDVHSNVTIYQTDIKLAPNRLAPTSGIPEVAPERAISPSYRPCSSALSPSPRSAPSHSRTPSAASFRVNPSTRFPSPTVSTVPEEPSSPKSGGRATGQDVRNHQTRVDFVKSSPVDYGVQGQIPTLDNGTVVHYQPSSPQTFQYPAQSQVKQSVYIDNHAPTFLHANGSPGSHNGEFVPDHYSRPAAMTGPGNLYNPVGYQSPPGDGYAYQAGGGCPRNFIHYQPSDRQVVPPEFAQTLPHTGSGSRKPYSTPGNRASSIPTYHSPSNIAPAPEWRHLPSNYSTLSQHSPAQQVQNLYPSHSPSVGPDTSENVVNIPSSISHNSPPVSSNRGLSPQSKPADCFHGNMPADYKYQGYPAVYHTGPPYCSNCTPQSPPRPGSREGRCDSTTTPCPLETYLPDHFKVFPLKQIFGPDGGVLPEYSCLCNDETPVIVVPRDILCLPTFNIRDRNIHAGRKYRMQIKGVWHNVPGSAFKQRSNPTKYSVKINGERVKIPEESIATISEV